MVHPTCSQLSLSVGTTRHNQPLGKKQHQRPLARENLKTGGTLGLPPVLVIRAISQYEAKEAEQFSFEVGDFFHVIEVITDKSGYAWFRVENPAKSILQGLVPASHFQKYGPTRPANLVPIPHAPPKQPQSLKVFPKIKVSLASTLHPTPALSKHTYPPKHIAVARRSQDIRPRTLSLGCRSLFGIVRFPFVAERADEMSAECGEPVIIVAHSAQEWFVVKPICRLRSPGLIPASYVEIQEIKTCRVLSPKQVTYLMQTSAIPTVDEWKKIVSDHRACCISLGIITEESDSMNPSRTVIESSRRPPLEEQNHPATTIEQKLRLADWRQRQATFIESAQQDSGLSLVEEEDENDAVTEANGQLRSAGGILWKAHIISFHYEQGQFWYQVQAHLRRSSSDPYRAQAQVLYRLDTHFRKLESDLQNEFSSENYTLPLLPSSAKPTDEIACAHRMEQLRIYMEEICSMPDSICTSKAVCEFLSSRPGDMELDDFEEEVESLRTKPNSNRNPPILQLPLEDNDSYCNMKTLEEKFRDSQRTGEPLLSDDIRSWITSWQATTADECRFSNVEPAPSTRPSSINSSSPSPTIENNHQRGSSLKTYSRNSLWIPDFDQPYSESSVLTAG